MKEYVLMHKNRVLAAFELNNNNEVCQLAINKKLWQYLPLMLKISIHYKYIEKETDNVAYIDEEGRYSLEEWISDRSIPVNRENILNYVDKKSKTINFALENHMVSLIDCYWVKEKNENIRWEDISLFKKANAFDTFRVIESNREKGTKYSGVNSTLGGCLEKYWFTAIKDTRKQLMLAKRHLVNYDILTIREVIATKIYESIGFKNYVKYKYVRNTNGDIIGCKCEVFTNEKLELITAYDLLAEFNLTQQYDTKANLIELASKYGANKQEVEIQLDIMTLVDYLITNRDRHLNNIGFLRDSDTLQIVGMAPIFDNGSSAYIEGQLPENVMNTTCHNMYNTEMECLAHVRNMKVLNLSKLPSKSWIKTELNKAINTKETRIQKLYQLYLDKIDYLKLLQSN